MPMSELITIIYYTKNSIKNFYVSFSMARVFQLRCLLVFFTFSVTIVSWGMAIVGLVTLGVEFWLGELFW